MLRYKEGRKSHENRLSSEISGTSFSGAVWTNSKSMISTNISFWSIRSQPDQGVIKRAMGIENKNYDIDSQLTQEETVYLMD